MFDINVTMDDDQPIEVTIDDEQPINVTIQGCMGTIENHNALSGLQGGDTDEYYHFSLADYTELSEWLDNVTLGDNGVTQLPQLVLTPSAAAVEAIEGGMFYNSGDKAIYVCTDV